MYFKRAQQLNTTFTAAKKELELYLSKEKLSLSTYGYHQKLNCTCKKYIISNVGKGEDGDNTASFTLTLQFTAISVNGLEFQHAEREMVLNILSSAGDFAWGVNNIQKVWQGDYPASVAIDDTSGEVYFLYLRPWGIELCYFATLKPQQLEAMNTLKLDIPYSIHLNPDVMFSYIENDVGLIELRKAVEIKFNTVVPITLSLAQYDRNAVRGITATDESVTEDMQDVEGDT